jgi:xanthine dehydrogenase YagS FAD-binding subunit
VAADAQAALSGRAVTQAVASEIGKAALEDATPLSQNRYKVQLARVAVKRALLMAAAGKI